VPASNATFLAEAVGTVGPRGPDRDGTHLEVRVPCVYKPTAGERPLWDFPDGTLALRERAAYLVSEALSWDVVPPTILRDGPHGPGMVQLWCEPAGGVDPVDLCAHDDVPVGYLRVLDATGDDGGRVSLVHEDTPALRRMAVFDVLVNNADRKGGHVLAMPDGHRFGVDHGVSLHVEDKLRTVLWGWAREPLEPEERAGVEAVAGQLAGGPLRDQLRELLTRAEVTALARRCDRLLRAGRMPVPSGGWPPIPWPAF
jgi:uncharacterized repeat protein (TIGR03843 family)